MVTNNILTPTQLIVGDRDLAYFYALEKLQNAFCTQDSDQKQNCFCAQCRKLKNEQHPFVVWINPEKEYKVDDIKIIFEKIKFTLEPDQKFFFVLQKAHTLNPTCANRLLKTLEEPPTGYNFLLLANNEQSVLPTIRSRSAIHTITQRGQSITTNPLLTFFCEPGKLDDPAGLEKTIREQGLTNSQSTELIHELVEHFEHKVIEGYKLDKNFAHSENVLRVLKQVLKHPPQSGSSAVFWKYLSVVFPRP